MAGRGDDERDCDRQGEGDPTRFVPRDSIIDPVSAPS
jgi:hypothetical protein